MAPKSATTAPLASVCSRTGCTGVSLMVVRWANVRVNGSAPAEPATAGADQPDSSNRALAQQSGWARPSTHSTKSPTSPLRSGEGSHSAECSCHDPSDTWTTREPSAYQSDSWSSRPGEE